MRRLGLLVLASASLLACGGGPGPVTHPEDPGPSFSTRADDSGGGGAMPTPEGEALEPTHLPNPAGAVTLGASLEPLRVSTDTDGSLVLELTNGASQPVSLPEDLTPYISFIAKFSATDGRLPAASAVAAVRPQREERFSTLEAGATRTERLPLARVVPACKDGCDMGRYEVRVTIMLGPNDEDRASTVLEFWVGPGGAALESRKEASYVEADAQGAKGIKAEVFSARELPPERDEDHGRVALSVRLTNTGRKHLLVPPQKYWVALCDRRLVAPDGSETRGGEGMGSGSARLGHEEVHDLAPDATLELEVRCGGERGEGELFVTPRVFATAKIYAGEGAPSRRAVVSTSGLPEVPVTRD